MKTDKKFVNILETQWIIILRRILLKIWTHTVLILLLLLSMQSRLVIFVMPFDSLVFPFTRKRYIFGHKQYVVNSDIHPHDKIHKDTTEISFHQY